VEVIGREFFIMQRIRGIAAGHRLTREELLVPDGEALATALGANLARIHAIRPPCAELAELGSPPPAPALATIAAYRAYLDTLSDSYPALEWGLRWCEVHAPIESEVTLIHRDYRTGNYLVDGGRLAAVLDWEFAGWGDPREDIGWFTARCWRFGANVREAGGIAGVEPFLRGYESVAGHRFTREELDYWQAMAHLRWAVIALQQAQRHSAGGERSLELALTGRIVHELEHELLQLIGKE
jgi:aminoglycoside phosphotransferase (APT) family kinase protein